MHVDVELYGPAHQAKGTLESKPRLKQFSKRSRQDKTSTDPCHQHRRLCWLHRSGTEGLCHPQGPACHQGRLLGLAFGYQGRPWKRELLGRIQTCTHTAHLPPVLERKTR